MAAGTYNLIVEQGATFKRTLVVSESGSPKDLTGYLGRAQIRKSYNALTPIITIAVNITDPINGVITLRMEASDTETVVFLRFENIAINLV